MDKEVVKRYLKQVPAEIRNPIKKLKNDQIWAVYIALVNEKPKFYGQLQSQFDANPAEMSRALKSLVESGLIDRETETFGDIGNPRKIFYSPTPLGIKFYDSLFDMIVPKALLQNIHLQKQGIKLVNWSPNGIKEKTPIQRITPQKTKIPFRPLDQMAGSQKLIMFQKAEGAYPL